VVNASQGVIEVRYKVKRPPDAVPPGAILPITPAIKVVAQLHQQTPWRSLSASEFTFDTDSLTAVVSLKPAEALRIEHRNLADIPADDAHRAQNFAIEEIHVRGSNGELHLKGEQEGRASASVLRSRVKERLHTHI